jgi:LPS sulfotransferase NodH
MAGRNGFCNILLQGMFARKGNRDQFVARETRMLAEAMERITRFRDAHPELAGQFIDVNYPELVSDPLAVVRAIYQRLDIQLTEEADERMQHFAGSRSRYKRRHASRTLEDLGLDGPTLPSDSRLIVPGLEFPASTAS